MLQNFFNKRLHRGILTTVSNVWLSNRYTIAVILVRFLSKRDMPSMFKHNLQYGISYRNGKENVGSFCSQKSFVETQFISRQKRNGSDNMPR